MQFDINKPFTQVDINARRNTFTWEYYLVIAALIFGGYFVFNASFREALVLFFFGNHPDNFTFSSLGMTMVVIFIVACPMLLVYEDIQYKNLLLTASQADYKKIKQAMKMAEVRAYVEAVLAQGRGLTYLEIFHLQDYRAQYKVISHPASH